MNGSRLLAHSWEARMAGGLLLCVPTHKATFILLRSEAYSDYILDLLNSKYTYTLNSNYLTQCVLEQFGYAEIRIVG